MKTTSLLACGIVLFQVLACGSNDEGATPSNNGSGGGGNTTATSAVGGSTPASTGVGGADTTASGGSSTTTSSPGVGGSAAGGTTSNTSAGGGSTDPVLPRASTLAGKLVINEVCPSNKTGATEGGSFPDWIELYNSTSADISLKGFSITDDSADLAKYPLTLDTLVVKAGGYLILWADGDVGETDFHLGFSLGAAGETLTILDSGQKVIDSMSWTNAAQDKTYARLPDGTGSFSWCTAGTPNRSNGTSCQ